MYVYNNIPFLLRLDILHFIACKSTCLIPVKKNSDPIIALPRNPSEKPRPKRSGETLTAKQNLGIEPEPYPLGCCLPIQRKATAALQG